jgi:hypothetical protein
MIYLALGGAALALYFWVTGGKSPLLKRREWRLLTGAAAVVAFTGAAFAGVRGAWGAAVVLLVVGLWFAASTRRAEMAAPPPPSGRMSAEEARRILGVTPEATREEVQAAYARLMRMAHPDKGGTAGLAAQLNAARDRLLGR